MAKRTRNKKASINQILDAAFLFYSTKPYDKFSLEEMAKHTTLSVGAIFYYFKTKNELFIQVCDKFLLEETSLFLKLGIYENSTFPEYINQYISILEEQKQKAKELGVDNLNRALVNITNQALFYYPDFAERGKKWIDLQIDQWKKVLIRAMVRGDIREDVNIDFIARLFEDIYCGLSYTSIASEDGIDLQELKDSFIFLYNSLKT